MRIGWLIFGWLLILGCTSDDDNVDVTPPPFDPSTAASESCWDNFGLQFATSLPNNQFTVIASDDGKTVTHTEKLIPASSTSTAITGPCFTYVTFQLTGNITNTQPDGPLPPVYDGGCTLEVLVGGKLLPDVSIGGIGTLVENQVTCSKDIFSAAGGSLDSFKQALFLALNGNGCASLDKNVCASCKPNWSKSDNFACTPNMCSELDYFSPNSLWPILGCKTCLDKSSTPNNGVCPIRPPSTFCAEKNSDGTCKTCDPGTHAITSDGKTTCCLAWSPSANGGKGGCLDGCTQISKGGFCQDDCGAGGYLADGTCASDCTHIDASGKHCLDNCRALEITGDVNSKDNPNSQSPVVYATNMCKGGVTTWLNGTPCERDDDADTATLVQGEDKTYYVVDGSDNAPVYTEAYCVHCQTGFHMAPNTRTCVKTTAAAPEPIAPYLCKLRDRRGGCVGDCLDSVMSLSQIVPPEKFNSAKCNVGDYIYDNKNVKIGPDNTYITCLPGSSYCYDYCNLVEGVGISASYDWDHAELCSPDNIGGIFNTNKHCSTGSHTTSGDPEEPKIVLPCSSCKKSDQNNQGCFSPGGSRCLDPEAAAPNAYKAVCTNAGNCALAYNSCLSSSEKYQNYCAASGLTCPATLEARTTNCETIFKRCLYARGVYADLGMSGLNIDTNSNDLIRARGLSNLSVICDYVELIKGGETDWDTLITTAKWPPTHNPFSQQVSGSKPPDNADSHVCPGINSNSLNLTPGGGTSPGS